MSEVKCTCEKATPNLIGRCNNCYEKSVGEIHMRALSENRVQMSEGKPREFWVVLGGDPDLHIEKQFREIGESPYSIVSNDEEVIHVIEKQAYTKAIEALKLAKAIMLRNSMFPGDIEKFNEILTELGV